MKKCKNFLVKALASLFLDRFKQNIYTNCTLVYKYRQSLASLKTTIFSEEFEELYPGRNELMWKCLFWLYNIPCISNHYLLVPCILTYKITKDQYGIMSGIFWLYDILLYQWSLSTGALYFNIQGNQEPVWYYVWYILAVWHTFVSMIFIYWCPVF